jgi:hypothetical protein
VARDLADLSVTRRKRCRPSGGEAWGQFLELETDDEQPRKLTISPALPHA